MNKILYHLERKLCPKCKKAISARPPGVLVKCLYGNQLLTYVAVQHYIYCNTLGHIEKQTGIGPYTLHDIRRTCLEGYLDSQIGPKEYNRTGTVIISYRPIMAYGLPFFLACLPLTGIA